MAFTPIDYIASYFGWTQFTPALPNFYWDVYSAEERIKKICFEIDKLCQYANMLSDNINIDHTLIKELQDALANIENIDELNAKVEALQDAADLIQQTLEALPSYSEFVSLNDNVDELFDTKIPWPLFPLSKYGTDGQVLRTNGDGSTQWQAPIIPTDEQASTYITQWLNAHPEATTTVQNDSVNNAKLVQTGGVLSSVIAIATHLIVAPNKYVNIDTQAKTLTIPSGSVLVIVVGIRAPFNIPINADLVLSIDASTIGSSAIKVFYNQGTGELVAQRYTYGNPPELLYICSMRIGSTAAPYLITCDFPWSVDNVPYGLDVVSMIADNSIPDTKLVQNTGIMQSVNSLSAKILLGTSKYANIDTSNSTLTFPPDTLIVYVTPSGTRNVKILAAESVIDISFATHGTTALKLFYNTSTEQFVVTRYNLNNPANSVYIGTLRTRGGAYDYVISCEFPWSVDNKPYNIDIPDPSEYILSYSSMAYVEPINIKSVNHRGFNTIAPENTIPAFIESCKHHYKYVETDVAFTSDDVAVLLHDDTINRTARNADGTEITETINIHDITYAEALTYDFGIYKGEEYAGTKIPTLNEFLIFCKKTGLHPYIEIKASSYMNSTYVTAVYNAVKNAGMRGLCTFISGNVTYLTVIKNLDTTARLGLITNGFNQTNITNAQSLQTDDNYVFIDSSVSYLEDISLAKEANIPVEVWTVNSLTVLNGIDMYITGVTTNNINAQMLLFESVVS